MGSGFSVFFFVLRWLAIHLGLANSAQRRQRQLALKPPNKQERRPASDRRNAIPLTKATRSVHWEDETLQRAPTPDTGDGPTMMTEAEGWQRAVEHERQIAVRHTGPALIDRY